MSKDSLKKRYLFKFFANVIGLAISFITQAIIPRGLGPKAYGDFNFLTNFFTQVVGFFDMGTSVGFYTKLSQRPKERGLASFYLFFVGLVSLIVLALVVIAYVTSAYERILPGQDYRYVFMAAVWGLLIWITGLFGQMADAYGVTVPAEKVRIFQKAFGLGIILVLFYTGQLRLPQFFLYHYLILSCLAGALVMVMEKSGFSLKGNWRLSIEQVKGYMDEFYRYSHPLFMCSLVALIVGIADRWLLQVFGGSVEQGFYSLSYQIGVMCFLFVNAMIPLLTREYSIAYGERDLTKMAYLFQRYNPTLYSITAYFSCFVAVQADKVIRIMGGSSFYGAAAAVTIMAFYPIHQAYGQLTASVFYATEQTRLYRNIGMFIMLFSLPASYFLLAPQDKMGLNAGATGLAVKMVLMNIVSVNVHLYYAARLLRFSFLKNLQHQVVSVACMLSIALVANFMVDNIAAVRERTIPAFLLGGVVYTTMVVFLAYCTPAVFGLKRQDMQSIVQMFGGKAKA